MTLNTSALPSQPRVCLLAASPSNHRPDAILLSTTDMLPHQTEPWSLRILQDGRVEVLDKNAHPFLTLDSNDILDQLLSNAGRLMACVNFCAGEPTQDLDDVVQARRGQTDA
jgi:hypothetical protein